MDKFRALQFFVTVSHKGSFIDAAKTLGTSPSTISKAIARLEDELGIQLFTRTTRALKLTPAGQQYLTTVKKLLNELDHNESELRNESTEISGTLKINVPISYGRLYIRPLIAPFCKAYPNISIDITYDDAYVDIIEKGIDITFRSGAIADNRLIARKLSPLDFLICTPKNYFPTNQHIQLPNDILHHPWINFRFKQTGKIMPVIINNDGQITEHYTDSLCIIDDGEALAELCADGAGLAQMPHFVARKWLLNQQIDALNHIYTSEQFSVYALYTKMKTTPPKVLAFIQFVQDWLSSIGETPNTTWARKL